MPKFTSALAAAALLILAAATPAVAESADNTRDRTLYTSAYASQWVDPNLREIPGRLLTDDLETRQAYFLGGGLGYVLVLGSRCHCSSTSRTIGRLPAALSRARGRSRFFSAWG